MKIALGVLYVLIVSIMIYLSSKGDPSIGGFDYWLGYYMIYALVWAILGTLALFTARRIWRYFALKKEWKESP